VKRRCSDDLSPRRLRLEEYGEGGYDTIFWAVPQEIYSSAGRWNMLNPVADSRQVRTLCAHSYMLSLLGVVIGAKQAEFSTNVDFLIATSHSWLVLCNPTLIAAEPLQHGPA
jgi:hypothetical protein